MKHTKTTKHALLMSILSLLLCVSMLVGTTFAWFTDEVVSGMNTITAGNLDVELLADGTPVNANTKLFADATLWEPGVVVYENLQIVNAGTLALKYRMALNFGNENNLNGNKLSDILKVAVLDTAIADGADRATILAAAKNAANLCSLQAFCVNGELEAGAKTPEQAVVIFWEPQANDKDNLFNANNGQTTSDGEALHIDFGVNLFATQKMSEEDSFGSDYDAGAPWNGTIDTDWYFDNPDATEFAIDTAEELAGLAALVNNTAVAPGTTYAARATTVQDNFADKTIKLGGNIDLGGLNWTAIGNWDYTFAGTFDGNGFIISNLYINDAKGEGIGLFGVVENATIKNVTINNANVTGYSMVAAVVGAPYPATISGCKVIGDVNIVADWAYVGGIAGYCYYRTQVEDCAVVPENTGLIKSNTRNAVGGITAWLLEGNHSVTNCQVKNLELVGWTNVGAITGFVHYSNTISGCTVENVKLVKTRTDGNPGIGLIAGGWSYSANNAITLSNNTINTATLEGTHIAYAAYNELYGSEYGGKTTTNFVLDNNTTANITNNLVEVAVAKTDSALSAAIQNGASVYLPAGTYTLPSMSGKEGVTIIGTEGTVIGGDSASTGFGSNFGKNSTIKNVTFSGTTNGARWTYANGGTTVFENCTFAGGSTYGFHIDESNGATFIFNNCTFSGFNAFAGDLVKIEFNNCTFLNNGYYGHTNIWSVAYLNDCTFGANTSISVADGGSLYFNGVEENYKHTF